MTVYGPYARKDGRQHVIHYDGVTRRTQSYPRYLMEQHLGRELLPEEHVDHVDGDATNNALENLQLLTQTANNQKSIKERAVQAEWLEFECPVCGDFFMLEARTYRYNQLKQKKAGPYCSKSCTGKAHH